MASCTLFDILDAWSHKYSLILTSSTDFVLYWFIENILAFLGLAILILDTALLKTIPYLEKTGMMILTLCPLLNIFVKVFYIGGTGWNSVVNLSDEVEFLGMLLLDLSYLNKFSSSALTDFLGFSVLSFVTLFDILFNFKSFQWILLLQSEYTHLYYFFGLLLLTFSSLGKHYLRASVVSFGAIKNFEKLSNDDQA